MLGEVTEGEACGRLVELVNFSRDTKEVLTFLAKKVKNEWLWDQEKPGYG